MLSKMIAAAATVLVSSAALAADLDRFAPADRKRIEAVAPDFVRDREGRFWDRQVERRRQEAGAKKVPDGELAALGLTPPEKDRIGRPKPESSVKVEPPLWYAALGGKRLTTPDEISEVATRPPAGFQRTRDRFVCVTVHDQDALAKRMKYTETRRGEYTVCDYVEAPSPVLVVGHTFKATGDTMTATAVKEVGTRGYFDQTLPILELATVSAMEPGVAPVTAEELASAIIADKAGLTEWRWTKKVETQAVPQPPAPRLPSGFRPNQAQPLPPQVTIITWEPRDVTPKPQETARPAAPATGPPAVPTSPQSLAPIQEPAPKAITVYVTKSGSKYHRAGCRYLRKSAIPLSLDEAKRRYSPCSECGPP